MDQDSYKNNNSSQYRDIFNNVIDGARKQRLNIPFFHSTLGFIYILKRNYFEKNQFKD